MSPQIAQGLLKLARRIGRWILEHLARWGALMLTGYMRGKVEDFGRRLARARAPRRKAWLRGRIRRWNAAIEWLVDYRERLLDCTFGSFDALSKGRAKNIPMVCEKAVAA